jgi:hypothetical protein
MFEVDVTALSRVLGALRDDDLPKMARNVLRDLARDVQAAEKEEIQDVFDRPTPYVQNSFRILKKAEAFDLESIVGIENKRIEEALKPSIPAWGSSRRLKAIENRARALRLLGADQYLVPSKDMKLDRYGNVPRAVAREMMTSLAMQYSGKRGKYTYAYRKGRPPKLMGIFLSSRLFTKHPHGALQLVATSKKPEYTKRFRYLEVAVDRAISKVPVYINREINRLASRHGLQ